MVNALEKLRKYMLIDGFEMVVDLEKSTPFYIYDKITNEQYLDMFTYFASAPLGNNHPKMRTEEFLQQLARAAVNKPSNSDCYTEELAEFVELFGRVAMKEEFRHLFLISGGSLAVENALKTSFDWKVRKNFANGEQTILGSQVIHFKKAFHGRSGYTLSLTNTHDPRKTAYFPKFQWPRITPPVVTFPIEEHLEAIELLEQQAIQEIEKTIAQNPKDMAALIIEPIQGEGGDNHFRKEFFAALRELCDKHEIMLIFDEVQTGLGLTGKMWAYEHFVKPDIVAFGKKTQVCGIMVTERVDEVEDNVFSESSRINSTWGGNLVDMLRSARYLEIIQEERLVENAEKVGKYLLRSLADACEESKLMTNARGRGLMCAFDLPNEELRDKLRKQLFKNKVMLLPAGEKSMRFRPPLCLDEEHVDEAVSIILKSCREIA